MLFVLSLLLAMVVLTFRIIIKLVRLVGFAIACVLVPIAYFMPCICEMINQVILVLIDIFRELIFPLLPKISFSEISIIKFFVAFIGFLIFILFGFCINFHAATISLLFYSVYVYVAVLFPMFHSDFVSRDKSYL